MDLKTNDYVSFEENDFIDLLKLLSKDKIEESELDHFELKYKNYENFIPENLKIDFKVKLQIIFQLINNDEITSIIKDKKALMEGLFFLFIPLSYYIKKKLDQEKRPLIIGINGQIGSGKTTLTTIIIEILKIIFKIKVGTYSIDDIYKTHSDLQDLKLEFPYFKFRGPPGTHDIDLALDIAKNFKSNSMNYFIPRYDKTLNEGLGDRSKNPIFIEEPLDILIIEGWFLGFKPIDESLIDNSKSLLKHVNRNLNDYLKIWDDIDLMIALIPEEFNYFRKWRIEAEDNMIKKTGKGMSNENLMNFIDYFESSLPPEIYLKNFANEKSEIKVQLNYQRKYKFI